MTGHASLQETYEPRRPHPRVFLRAWQFLRPYQNAWLIVLVLTLVMSAATLLGPWLKQQGIDDGIRARDAAFLFRIVWISLIIHLLNIIASFFQGRLLTLLGQNSVHDLRVSLVEHLQKLSLDFYEKQQPGKIISRAVNDLEAVNELISAGIMAAFADTIMLIGVAVILFSYNAALAGMVFALLPVLAAIAYGFQGRIHNIFTHARETISAVSSTLHETVAGIRVIKSLARERLSEEHFALLNTENQRANVAVGTVFAGFMPAVEITYAIAICTVLWYGGILYTRGEIGIGVIVAFILYVGQFFDPVRRLIELFGSVPRALVGLNRILEILDREPTVQDVPGAQELLPFHGSVQFEHVGFSYDTGPKVLDNITLHAKYGEMVALVGLTGAGKSTIIKLLSRMYDVKEGAILIDGYDVREVTQASLRQQMGMVQQETFLFAGSVRENIRYSRPEATDEEIEEVAKNVRAHDFIMRLPNGYDTDISERGIRLSGGQRQLVSFARALLVNPRILILDEATSSVDHFTEVYIQEALQILLKDRVSFIIAHRISTVRNADQILVLDKGRIVARGRHEELAATCPLYQRLYQHRFLNDIENP